MTAEEYLRGKYGAYRGHPFWREIEAAFNAGTAAEREAMKKRCAEVVRNECIGFAKDGEQLNRIAAAIMALDTEPEQPKLHRAGSFGSD